jgi:hypothetical protein
MTPHEKDQLLALFADQAKWCRKAEACNGEGRPVVYDDPSAVAWDITGALCLLFGWPRACILFEQLDRRIHGKVVKTGWPPRDWQMEAMAALQKFNDGAETTLEILRAKLESAPAWRIEHSGNERIKAVAHSQKEADGQEEQTVIPKA